MSALPVWYFPSHAGDFRLVKRGDGCTLIVEKPTLGEQAQLQKFGKKMQKHLPQRANEWDWGVDREVPIDMPVEKAGKILLKFVRAKKAVLTAVVSAKGKVTVSEDTEAGVDALAKDDTKAAASVTRPTPCCPLCIPGAITRASEVLLSFLSPREHEQWAKHRAISVVGGLSGHRYILAHRNTDRAVKQTKICFDFDDGAVLHFHDWSVPPEEEILAAKLILEHREPWLRNEATALGYRRYFVRPGVSDVRTRLQFKNPFGDIKDGIADADFTADLGELARALLPS